MKDHKTLFFKNIITSNNRFELFILLTLLYLLSAVLINEYVIHDELYYRSLGEHMNISVIDELISLRAKWQWTGYIGIPVVLILKFIITGTFISMGVIITGHKLTFGQILTITMIAEFAYLTASFVTTINLMTAEISTLEDLGATPLSLASLIPSSSVKQYLYVPMKSINLFLVLYILLMAWCYKISANCSFNQALTLILPTYGTAFVLWNLLVIYLLISYA